MVVKMLGPDKTMNGIMVILIILFGMLVFGRAIGWW